MTNHGRPTEDKNGDNNEGKQFTYKRPFHIIIKDHWMTVDVVGLALGAGPPQQPISSYKVKFF
jgi:hypothetical protein